MDYYSRQFKSYRPFKSCRPVVKKDNDKVKGFGIALSLYILSMWLWCLILGC